MYDYGCEKRYEKNVPDDAPQYDEPDDLEEMKRKTFEAMRRNGQVA